MAEEPESLPSNALPLASTTTSTTSPTTPTTSLPSATPGPSNNQRQTTPFRNYFRWTTALVTVLLRSLLKSKEKALQTDGGFKSAAWHTALEDVIKAGGEECDVKRCKNKYQEQRRIWKEWLLHIDVSGWGWDEERGVPVTDPEIMDVYFAKYPARAPFRDRPPLYQQELAALIGDRVARGKHAGGALAMLTEDDVEEEGIRDSIQPSVEDNEDSTPATSSSPTPAPSDGTDYSERQSINKRAAGEMYNPRAKKPATGSRLLVEALNRSTQAFTEAFNRAGERLDVERQKKSSIQVAVDIVRSEMKSKSVNFRVKLLSWLTEGNNAEVFNSMLPDERDVYTMKFEDSQGLAGSEVTVDSSVEGDKANDEGKSDVEGEVRERSVYQSPRPRRKGLRQSSR